MVFPQTPNPPPVQLGAIYTCGPGHFDTPPGARQSPNQARDPLSPAPPQGMSPPLDAHPALGADTPRPSCVVFVQLGALYTRGKANWTPHAVRAGNLITGQNPASAQRTAEMVVEALTMGVRLT